MKIKFTLTAILILTAYLCEAQYIGVRARYSETRVVDDFPNPPKRENRLVLSFYAVSDAGVYTPIALSNFSLWIYKEGLQYGGIGGILDSTGNNYPGYSFTAPRAVAYYNSYQSNWIDCAPHSAIEYVVNGHELDCGFIGVSCWTQDFATGDPLEHFTAPNICLPYYHPWQHPYATAPGNVNFGDPVVINSPFNYYHFTCSGSTQQLIIRGVISHHISSETLPVRFDNVKTTMIAADKVKLYWSNLNEYGVRHYEVQRSKDGQEFTTVGFVFPKEVQTGSADYIFPDKLLKRGSYYYRIKALEQDGTISYSQVVRVSSNSASSDKKIEIQFTGDRQFQLRVPQLPTGRYAVKVLNMTGQQVAVMTIDHKGGATSYPMQLPVATAGIYQLLLQSSAITLTQKMIIN